MITETLKNAWRWWRICEAGWVDPLDPAYARERGGRWNPPDSYPTLYLNEDQVTARLNLRRFIEGWPFEPEDLRAESGPMLVGATLPANQEVCDVHSVKGVAQVGLPRTYPHDAKGQTIAHVRCQQIGAQVHNARLRGVRARSAQGADGAGRELAWFPARTSSRATRVTTLNFEEWFWG